MTALAAVALWLHPVILAGLALRVAGGEADAPWLALAALIAPLVALLAPARRAPEQSAATGTIAAGVLALLLAADFLIAADAAALLGGAAWQGVAFAAALALLIVAWPAAGRAGVPAVALGAVALVLPLGAVAAAAGGAPWITWSHGASRPALTFSERGGWARDGERFAVSRRLGFHEGQRVTAVAPGVFRVVERDAAPPIVREWRLPAGGALTLRPGDELRVEAGARLRFEAGRRVPGLPVSGPAWADAPARGPWMLPAALGALVTFVGGALALVPPSVQGDRAVVAGPLVLLVALAGAVGWGLYAAATAPELALGASPLALMLRLPPMLTGARGGLLAMLALTAFCLVMLSASAAARMRLAGAAASRPGVWAAVVAVAAMLAVWARDPWELLLGGLGLAASSWAPARLASSPAGALVGTIVGGVAFVALVAVPALAPGAPAWLEPLVRYPALVALPLGWLAARVVPPAPDRLLEPSPA